MPTRQTCADYPDDGRAESPPRTILLAEDSEDFRLLLAMFLRGRGYEVFTAKDGPEAVEAAVSHRPAVVLMDIGLPDVDGLSATRRIRERLTPAETAILVVTAYDSAEFRADALEAGCDGYIVKPVAPSELLEKVAVMLRRSGGDESEAS